MFFSVLLYLLFFSVQAGLIHKLRHKEKERERERQRMLRPRSREFRRSLSYDAPPFHPMGEAGNAVAIDGSAGQTGGGGGTGGGGVGQQQGSGDSTMTQQRRQLGERLYPKVSMLQPVY